MPPSHADRPVAALVPTPAGALIAGYAALLAAHARGIGYLTRRGLAHVTAVLQPAPAGPPARGGTAPGWPVWDRMRRQLWLGGRLVRQFARLAPGQMALLDACQACGWEEGGATNPFRGRAGRQRPGGGCTTR